MTLTLILCRNREYPYLSSRVSASSPFHSSPHQKLRIYKGISPCLQYYHITTWEVPEKLVKKPEKGEWATYHFEAETLPGNGDYLAAILTCKGGAPESGKPVFPPRLVLLSNQNGNERERKTNSGQFTLHLNV